MIIKDKIKLVIDITLRFAFFVSIAYISISAVIGCRIARDNKEMIDKIMEMDTVQCNKIKQLIKSNNSLVETVDFLMLEHFNTD